MTNTEPTEPKQCGWPDLLRPECVLRGSNTCPGTVWRAAGLDWEGGTCEEMHRVYQNALNGGRPLNLYRANPDR